MQQYKRDNLRKTIQPGDIIFTRSESLIGKLIRWTTSSNIDHVAYYIGNGLIIESTLGYGVRIVPLDIYINDTRNEIYLARVQQQHDIWSVITYSYNFYGIKYDIIGQLGIFFRFMIQKLGLQKLVTFLGANKINSDGLWCSEFIGIIFTSVNIRFDNMDVSYLSPADIYNSSIVNKIEF